jgi:hypothetical protein
LWERAPPAKGSEAPTRPALRQRFPTSEKGPDRQTRQHGLAIASLPLGLEYSYYLSSGDIVKGVPYEFTEAQQLLNDFFDDVDRVLVEVKKR